MAWSGINMTRPEVAYQQEDKGRMASGGLQKQAWVRMKREALWKGARYSEKRLQRDTGLGRALQGSPLSPITTTCCKLNK